jgi:3-hydroxyacyl-[acyl-carrier-protein] dehydratase
MAADQQMRQDILNLVPQQYPFRFIDEILELDDDRIVGTYRFREDEYFYRGHFPNQPITPGVILIETMAQTGVVAFGIYQLLQSGTSIHDIRQLVTLFTMADNVEFNGIVSPGEKVIVTGEKVYLRRGNLKAHVAIEREDGELVCCGILTGRGVTVNEK